MVDAVPWSDVFSVLLKQLGIIVGTFTAMGVFWIFWLKVKLKGRIYARFFDLTNFEDGELIKVSVSDAVPTLQSITDDQHYLIDVDTQTQMHYPPGLPVILQEPVQVQHYVRGVNTPYNPRQHANSRTPGTSSAALTNIKNQEFAKTMAERINDELGGKGMNSLQKILLLGVACLGAGLTVVGFMVYQMFNQMNAIQAALGV